MEIHPVLRLLRRTNNLTMIFFSCKYVQWNMYDRKVGRKLPSQWRKHKKSTNIVCTVMPKWALLHSSKVCSSIEIWFDGSFLVYMGVGIKDLLFYTHSKAAISLELWLGSITRHQHTDGMLHINKDCIFTNIQEPPRRGPRANLTLKYVVSICRIHIQTKSSWSRFARLYLFHGPKGIRRYKKNRILGKKCH